ncbi:uncharacterized protein BKA55DRAFT_522900 [Fusarium redolens]|uniref:Uncharacterized protein n=1 Tax=Fusarium redolens TaxID=48865 RepID=A0A9P9JUN5_FUSRE|nr:uncharacterized protein BKA55DRAFT_522900 [Fusarium redolens]KAH7233981.1 hypothetical protein BKA55DRAFT_522900 [Fusarium redolens]
MKLLSVVTTLAILSTTVSTGPVAYGVCQAGCAGVVMACYGAAGYTWGATVGATAPATIIACNSAFGTCIPKVSPLLFDTGDYQARLLGVEPYTNPL